MTHPFQRSQPHWPSPETQSEVEAALAARMELGPEYSEHVAAGLAERVEHLAAIRTAELRQESSLAQVEAEQEKSARSQRFVLGLVSVSAGVPITAIAATNVDPSAVGVVVSWLGIVGVNAVHALGGRRRR